MKNIDSFKIYPRKKHRYKLGEENIIEHQPEKEKENSKNELQLIEHEE